MSRPTPRLFDGGSSVVPETPPPNGSGASGTSAGGAGASGGRAGTPEGGTGASADSAGALAGGAGASAGGAGTPAGGAGAPAITPLGPSAVPLPPFYPSSDPRIGGPIAPDPEPRVAALHYAGPYAVYADGPRSIRVFGTALDLAQTTPVLIGSEQLGTLTEVSADSSKLMLPALRPGTYTLHLASQPEATGARLVVVERPRYVTTQVEVPGRVESLFYDAERDAYFAVFWDLQYNYRYTLARVRCRATECRVDRVDLPAPTAVALSADGRELLVMNEMCMLAHVDPESLAIGKLEELTCDVPKNRFTVLIALADGKLLYSDPDGLEFHERADTQSMAVRLNNLNLGAPFALASRDGTRSIWATLPRTSTRSIYHYDAGSGGLQVFRTTADYYQPGTIALSADGRLFMHDNEIYDDRLQLIGTLPSEEPNPSAVALSGDGKLAAIYSRTQQSIRAFDLSGSSAPFAATPRAQMVGLPADQFGYADRLYIDDDARTVFAFTQWESLDRSMHKFYLVVRPLE